MRQLSIYEAAGGAEAITAIVDRFYDGVAGDSLLRPLYPEAELDGARRRLALFLIQYWGGPAAYAEERGHPRLRARHLPFAIGAAERDRWLHHMRQAVREQKLSLSVETAFLDYFERASTAMINRPAGQTGAENR